MRKSGFLRAFVVVVALAVGLAVFCEGCGEKREETVEIVEGGTFYYCLAADPRSLDPADLQGPECVMIGKQIYDGLMDYDPETMELTPAMAESYEVSEDATVFTFKLKEGVMFHNGRECTAQDFAYAWNRLVDPATASEVAYHLSPVRGFEEFRAGKVKSLEGVRAVDDFTLEVTLAYPYADFVCHTAHPALSPIPEEVVEEYGSESFSEHPVGTGPFRFVDWVHEQEVITDKFLDYYGEKAHLDSVVYKVYSDEETAYQDFKAGALNECQIPQGQFEAAAQEYGDHAVFTPTLAIIYVGYNVSLPPWKDNKALRKALNYAVDRQTLADALMEGRGKPATGLVSPSVPGYQANPVSYTYDPEKAKSLLAEAGFPNGQGLPELTLAYHVGGGREELMRFVQDNLKDIGVNCDLQGYEWDTYLNLIRAGRINFFHMQWNVDYPSLDKFLSPLYYAGNMGIDNLTRYDNPQVDQLMLRARGTIDRAERLELYREAERVILEDAPVIPLLFYRTSRVSGDDIGGYIRAADDTTPMERVYFTPAKTGAR